MAISLLLALAAQVGDAATTIYGARNGAAEGNPIARKLFEAVGVVPAVLGVKLVIAVLLVKVNDPHINWAFAAVFGAITAWNITQIIKAKKK